MDAPGRDLYRVSVGVGDPFSEQALRQPVQRVVPSILGRSYSRVDLGTLKRIELVDEMRKVREG